MSVEFDLPDELIARYPPDRRDGGRLLVLRRPSADAAPAETGREHALVSALPDLLEPGDLLVVNDTRVMPSRLQAARATGGRVEALLLEPGPGPIEALLRPSRRLKVGERLTVVGADGQRAGAIELLERSGETWRVRTEPPPLALMSAAGELPLPPYLGRAPEASDAERYQTVFADAPGAVAAPTAGLHLSERVLAALAERGIDVARITLRVGLGTFRPLRPEDIERGELHPERYVVPPETAEAIRACRARGGRVIAVGTTVTRTLESATPPGERAPTAGGGVTRLFIQAGYRFRCVDALLTNFHLPGTSLLRLVFAFAGREPALAAYREAVELKYRFYSYGDAMLLL